MLRGIFVLFMVVVSGCGSYSSIERSEMGAYEPRDIAALPISESRDREGAIETRFAAPEAEPTQVQLSQRQVIYSASLRLVVVSRNEAMAAIRKIADMLGGHLQESDGNSITIRVPANQFDSAVDQIAKQGEVLDRAVKASDVTEQMMDLNIRLDNAKKTRDRLLAIMEKLDKLEETLKVEAELLRLSTEIETMEGKLRYMKSQIAMSTIRVELNSTQPRQAAGDPLGLPFLWVTKLGDGLVAGTVESMPRKPHWFAGGPKFDPPGEFIRYYADENLVEAMNADGIRIKVQRQENFDKGMLSFWTKLARRSLVETRALAIEKEEVIDANAAMIVGTRDVSGTAYSYLLVLTRNDRYLFTFEAWGAKAKLDALRAELEKSGRSLQR